MLKFWFEESAAEAEAAALLAALDQGPAAARTTRDGIPLEQILRDRPDVFRAFFEEYHGGRNDSHAWAQRVGGATPQDYANYWYEQHGRWEGYGQGAGGAAAPREDGEYALPPGIVETGRTTAEGYLISHVLAERPDLFRAFFTEYYGPNNDHRSTAWVDRVGGTTVEDYANYWWETYGRASGWTPGRGSPGAGSAGEDQAGGSPGGGAAPLVIVYTEDGVILRPAEPDDIIEDGVVVGRVSSGEPGQGSPDDAEPQGSDWVHTLPLVIHYRDDGVDLLPAQPGEVVVEGVVLVGQALTDYLAGMF